MRELTGKHKGALICVLLVCGVLAIYWQVLRSDFVNFDDTIYVTNNEHVKTGFSLENIKWVVSIGKVAYWHPLTWLSHMLDSELYGLRPGLHHLTSLIIHIVNSLLVFLVLRRMTGALWKSAFVAAVFAVHPMNVDSVAWVAERKNVLSTMFWLLTMWAYTRYVREGGVKRYLAALGLFILGLLAKPMLITLPFAMLLLDYWPLGRLSLEQPGTQAAQKAGKPAAPARQTSLALRLIWEKIPFFAFSAISVFLSFMAMRRLGITASTELVPLKLRLENAFVSYIGYIDKIICPRKLAVFYPYPMEVALWRSLGALLFLACVSFLFIWVLRKKAYLSIGWLWFIGTLVPVIGLVQAGLWPAIGDRWAYVPMIGLLIVVAWGAGDLAAWWRLPTKASIFGAGACLLVLMFCTYRQVGYWRNSHTLFTHTLEVTTNNYIAHVSLGNAFIKDGRTDEAMKQYKRSVEIHPDYADARYNLGVALALQGNYELAAKEYLAALRLEDFDKTRLHLGETGRLDRARLRLGETLTRIGKLDEAIAHFEKLLQSRPDDVEVLNNYALALVQSKRIAQAIELYNKALLINPDSFAVLNNLARALADQNQFDLAIVHLRRALSLNPDFLTYYNLGRILKLTGQLDDAAECYRQALKLVPDDEAGHYSLGRILTEQKKYDQAAEHYEKAIQLDADFSQAYYHLGMLFSARGETDKAIDQFREVLRIHPNDAEMRCNLGTLLARQGRLDDAITQFRRALRLDPNLSRAADQLKAALERKSAPNTQ